MNRCCELAVLIRKAPLALLLAACFLLGVAFGTGKEARSRQPTAKGSSWPMFGGTPNRNMVNPVDKKIATDWKVEAPSKNIKWSEKIGSRGYTTPAIAGGKVFVATNNDVPRDPKVKGPKAVLMCFQESNGKFLWQLTHDMPGEEVAREALRDGLCSTPAVDGDRLYYVTPACEVVCASTAGKVLWTFDMMKKLKVYPCYIGNCSPLVVENRVFVATGNGRNGDNELPSPRAPSFAAFHKKTGELAWKDSSPGTNIIEGQWSNPAYAVVKGKSQVIFPGGDGWLYAFEPRSGKPLWKFDCNLKGAVFGRRGTRNYIVSTPVVYDNKVYITTGLYPEHPLGPGPGHLWCIDMSKTGDISAEMVVDPKAKPVRTKPNPNTGVVWHVGGAIKPKPQDGRTVHLGRTASTCAIHDGLVYVAEEEGYLNCFDAKNGKKYWSFDFKSGIWGSPYWVDGKVYIGDVDSDVFVFAHGKVEKKLAQIEMGESVHSTPVVANGVLYIMTKSRLFAIANNK
jgi:outer membrane protein assembly factor BamB